MEKFQRIAALWHGGQYTAMYAFASAGTIAKGLEDEINECIGQCRNKRELKQLIQFKEFIIAL